MYALRSAYAVPSADQYQYPYMHHCCRNCLQLEQVNCQAVVNLGQRVASLSSILPVIAGVSGDPQPRHTSQCIRWERVDFRLRRRRQLVGPLCTLCDSPSGRYIMRDLTRAALLHRTGFLCQFLVLHSTPYTATGAEANGRNQQRRRSGRGTHEILLISIAQWTKSPTHDCRLVRTCALVGPTKGIEERTGRDRPSNIAKAHRDFEPCDTNADTMTADDLSDDGRLKGKEAA